MRRDWLETIAGIEGLRCDGTKATFRSPTVNATVAAMLTALDARGIDVTELHISKSTLEDVFLELTAEGADQSG